MKTLSKEQVFVLELRAELRDLASAEKLADYELIKWTLPEGEWEKVKESIKERLEVVLAIIEK